MLTASNERARFGRLVRNTTTPTRLALDSEQQQVVDHPGGPLLVLAGPGTGKTTLLVEAVAERVLARNEDPERILLLTFSRRAAAQLREQITTRIGRTTKGPIARSFHSYAFGVLRRQAALLEEPPPRLLSGPEQDVLIRELLRGDAEAMDSGSETPFSRASWPTELRPALPTRGFAEELRNLLLRAIERGIGPDQLAAFGAQLDRADWQAAAAFMWQYLQVTALSGSSAYDPAELIAAVVESFHSDPELLTGEQQRYRRIFVDEYQDTDPAQREMLQLLARPAKELIVVGDPDQSTFGFRGADPRGIREFTEDFAFPDGSPAQIITLHANYRSSSQLCEATRRIANRLTGPAQHRQLTGASPKNGQSEVHILRSPMEQASYIAHRLRVAHLREGIAWRDMAVVVRSASHIASLRRAASLAGVPCTVASDDTPLVGQPAVRSFVLLLQRALQPDRLTEDTAVELLTSALGRADGLTLRRLRRELRHIAVAAGDYQPHSSLLVAALQDPTVLAVIPESCALPATRIAELLELAQKRAAQPGVSAEDVLWTVWSHTGLAETWQQTSLRGGALGAAADRDLDAIVALFDMAAQFTDRLPHAGAEIFVDYLSGQQLPGDTLAPKAPDGDTVRFLTAHAAKGGEWELVVVAGVQEGQWPDLRRRGSLLGAEILVDVAAGRDITGLDSITHQLHEERRLFYVAATRARQQLILTAVRSEEEQPSRFVDEIDPVPIGEIRPYTKPPRTLSLPALVAELRSVVSNSDSPMIDREAAAQELATLAEAGVAGAHPYEWWGLVGLSDDRPLCLADEQVAVSPSHVDKFLTCELRWLLETAGGTPAAGLGQVVGNLVHDLAALTADSESIEPGQLSKRLDAALSILDLGGPWQARKERERAHRLLGKFLSWLQTSRSRLGLVGVEIPFTAPLHERATIRGRVDRLEQDREGRLVVIDLKTGRTIPAEREVEKHAQLGTYQLAVELGGFADSLSAIADNAAHLSPDGGESGGAALVQLGSSAVKYKEQTQQPLSECDDPLWAHRLVTEVAQGMAGSSFRAIPTSQCRGCPVRTSCPAQPEGRQVTL